MWDLRTLTQFQESKISPGLFTKLYGWMHETSKMYLVIVECSQVVVSAGYHAGASQFNFSWQPIFDYRFAKFRFRSSGDIKFCSPS